MNLICYTLIFRFHLQNCDCLFSVTLLHYLIVPEMLSVLQKPDNDPNYQNSLVKASAKLHKVLREVDIRLLMDGLMQNNLKNGYVYNCLNLVLVDFFPFAKGTALTCVGLRRKLSEMRKHL